MDYVFSILVVVTVDATPIRLQLCDTAGQVGWTLITVSAGLIIMLAHLFAACVQNGGWAFKHKH